MAKLSAITATNITYQEAAAPSTPASTKWVSYFKTDGQYYKDDAGVETGPLTGAGAGAPTDATYLTTSANGTLSNEVVVTAPSSGGNVAKIVRKTADETVNNSSTLQNDDHLLLALASSEVWKFEFWLMYTSGSTPDFKAAITVPASATLVWETLGATDTSSVVYGAATITASGTSRDFASSTGTRFLKITGIVANSTNAGNLQLQWAQNTATVSDTIVLTNSTLTAWKLA